MGGIIKKHVLGGAIILAAFSLVSYFLHDFRFSDPDQYYHYSVSRHLAETWSFWTLPQVKGMGWDQYFADKEFLFHLFTAIGYRFFSEAGVQAVAFLCSLAILVFLYLNVFQATKNYSLAIFAAVAPLFSETYVLRLMLIRAYLPGVAAVFAMTYFLQRQKKWGVFAAAFIFSLSYHAFYIPLMVLVAWAAVQAVHQNSDRLPLFGALGLLAGFVINPYFPANIVLSVAHVRVALDQFSNTGLFFGPEQEPYRTDNFLRVFRYAFVFMGLGAFVLWLKFYGSHFLKKSPKGFDDNYLFFGGMSTLLFVLMFLSPRFQEYFLPFVCIYAALSIYLFQYDKKVLTLVVGFLVVTTMWANPYQNFKNTVGAFKQFDHSYLSMVRDLKDKGYVFNCEWWGGHYLMYARPEMQLLDVLDPTLLRSHDPVLFETVKYVRQGHALDPYHVLKNILKFDYVLCSSKTAVNAQLLGDPRFQKLWQAQNIQETLYSYRLRQPNEVTAIFNFETRTGSNPWQPWVRQLSDPSATYLFNAKTQECIDVRPTSEELKKFSAHDYFMLSGTGAVIIYKDSQVYLQRTELSPERQWGEILLPMSEGREWVFKMCPDAKGEAALGVFLLTNHQQNLVCETSKSKLGNADLSKTSSQKEKLPFALSISKCDAIRAEKAQ